MRRDKAVKTQRRKALKSRSAPKVSRNPSAANAYEKIALLERRLNEALEQQTATSEVLKVISSSRGELAPAFEAMLENAVRICEANFGNLLLFEDGGFRHVALYNAPRAWAAEQRRDPIAPRESARILYRVVTTKEVAHVADVGLENPDEPIAKIAGARTLLIVPMLKDRDLAGVIAIYRREVRPFTDKQIDLVKNFAAQAVIAIENARLLNELRESLQQQTATADVLKVISSSPGKLESVFSAILANATHICGAKFGTLYLRKDDAFFAAAFHNAPPAFIEARKDKPLRPAAETTLVRAATTKQVVQTLDATKREVYRQGDPFVVAGTDLGGFRTIVSVPMLKDDELIGVISIYRQEVLSFTDKQIDLVKNFADQAVIAIENTRLLNELRQRTDDLSESLGQQTATSEVLKVISGSQGELEPVFEIMLANATRLCEANYGALWLHEGDGFRPVAIHGALPPAWVEQWHARTLFHPGPDVPLALVRKTREPIQVSDMRTDPSYLAGDPLPVSAVEVAGIRTLLVVPMVKENEFVGAIAIYRREVKPFNDKQIELMKNFAAQAVIAIENTRLLDDLNKLNQQLEQRVTDQVGEIERMGRLRRFLPPQVADLIVASGAEKQLESHRREITALFCDLRGFTGFSESADPEDVMALLREYHAAIGEIIIKYSGTLERYAGDGVMVVFNDPIPVENPAHQAVLMAIEMRAAIGALTEKWRKLGHDIGFGIGIAHGFATLGTIGFEGRFDYAAIGTVSNVASRLCDEAKPGQILISPRVLMAVEKDITVEPAGDFALKGIRRPMTAYNVLAAKAAN